jgi:hypothetical protein
MQVEIRLVGEEKRTRDRTGRGVGNPKMWLILKYF